MTMNKDIQNIDVAEVSQTSNKEGIYLEVIPRPEAYYSSLQPESKDTTAAAQSSRMESNQQKRNQCCTKPPCWGWVLIAFAVVATAFVILVTTTLVLNSGSMQRLGIQSGKTGAPVNHVPSTAKDCAELFYTGKRTSSVYTINPDGDHAIGAYCDMVTEGGGWTVFQKRFIGNVDFYRGWEDYAIGFGEPEGDYWLGLRYIHAVTDTQPQQLRVNVTDFDLGDRYAKYGIFNVSSEADKFRLSIGAFSGNAGDSLAFSNGMQFSTNDMDNDISHIHCAVEFKSAGWERDCSDTSFNGLFPHTQMKDPSYMNWEHLRSKDDYTTIKAISMMIRPVYFEQ